MLKEKASILIVDDDLDICKTLSLILESEGYHVKIANTRKEAIEKSKEKQEPKNYYKNRRQKASEQTPQIHPQLTLKSNKAHKQIKIKVHSENYRRLVFL